MNIGLVAHDAKKKLMQNFCIAYRGILGKNTLYATGTTGRLIEEVTNLNVHKYLAGHLGGEQQMAFNFLSDILLFNNVSNILRLCDINNIPAATNLASAELMIKALDRGDLDWRELYKS